jgi:hypothetical protein
MPVARPKAHWPAVRQGGEECAVFQQMGAVVGEILIAIKRVGKIFSNGHRQVCFAGLTSASQKSMHFPRQVFNKFLSMASDFPYELTIFI